jgi:hypothetical protein
MSLPNVSINNGFQEEYWLGHRMIHCSGRKKNVETRDNYIYTQPKKIKAGDELFWDYNRDCFCRVCKKHPFFLAQELSTFVKCRNCQGKKSASNCVKIVKISGALVVMIISKLNYKYI